MNQKDKKEIDNWIEEASPIDKEKEIKEKLKKLEAKKAELEKREIEEQKKKLKEIKEDLNENNTYKPKKKKKEAKKPDEQIVKEVIPTRETPNIETKKEPKKISYMTIFMVIAFIISLVNIYYNAFLGNSINKIYNIFFSSLISSLILCLAFYKKRFFKYLSALLVIAIITLPLLTEFNIIKFPTLESVPNFVGWNMDEALKWGNDNHIDINTAYEYSDIHAEYEVMNQDILVGTLLKNIKEINLTISNGPNYDKTVIIPNMVGWNIDDVIDTINKNFLNNVTIDYVFDSNIKRDTILTQSFYGEMKRNSSLAFTVSLGDENALTDTTMIDLKNKSLFDATLFLKRNGIKYEIKYEFSDTVKKDHVINQSEQEGSIIKVGSTITLTISKGSEIKVPNLTAMTTDEIISWVIKNNLKIKFSEKYDINIAKGKIISANYKENDIVSEGTTIEIVTSKGQLILPNFTSLSEFRSWAATNNIKYTEEYEFNSNVSEGSIIKFNVKSGEAINPADTIVVYISNGTSVTVPNFYGMTKTEATNKCKKVGLSCSFYDTNSSKTKGTVVTQNKKANTTVSKGTTVKIGLSTGKTGSSSSSTCDKSKGSYFYIAPGSTGTQVYQATKNQNPNFTIKVTYVDNCSNGASTSGMVCNSSSYDSKWISYCTTINLTIVK